MTDASPDGACRHPNSQTVVFNDLVAPPGRISVGWCPRCGAYNISHPSAFGTWDKEWHAPEVALLVNLAVDMKAPPLAMRLPCPSCGALHIDEGEFATKPHHTHACQECGMVWRPAIVPTVGVRFLPGFKNDEAT